MAEESSAQTAIVLAARVSLFPQVAGEGPLLARLLKETKAPVGVAPSRQGVWWGPKYPPFDVRALTQLQMSNTYHATCVHTKVAAIAGLGFRTPSDKLAPPAPDLGSPEVGPTAGDGSTPGDGNLKIDEEPDPISLALDDLCETSFLDVLCSAIEDYIQTGNGYMEIVRNTNNEIAGIHHIPAPDVVVVIEDEFYNRHYQIMTSEAAGIRRFAKFGDLQDFLRRASDGSASTSLGYSLDNPSRTSEVIHLRKSTSLNRYYGWPEHVAATPAIELSQCVYQHNYDFFLNRGVPEFMLFITGGKLNEEDWKKVQAALASNVGLQQSHKSFALNLSDPNIVIKVEKLALEGKTEGGFTDLHDTLALAIVSAHRVPHLLAGIQLPGKLGAANELPNALMAFQTLVCGPHQNTISTILKRTLGNPKLASYAGTAPLAKDFVFREIIDRINTGTMDTISRMKTPVAQAQAQGRDPAAGLLKGDIAPDEAQAMLTRLNAARV